MDFAEQMAYDLLEMPEPFRSDWRSAHIVKTIIDVNRTAKSTPIKLDDCKLDFNTLPVSEEEKLAEMETSLKNWFAMNKNIKRIK